MGAVLSFFAAIIGVVFIFFALFNYFTGSNIYDAESKRYDTNMKKYHSEYWDDMMYKDRRVIRFVTENDQRYVREVDEVLEKLPLVREFGEHGDNTDLFNVFESFGDISVQEIILLVNRGLMPHEFCGNDPHVRVPAKTRESREEEHQKKFKAEVELLTWVGEQFKLRGEKGPYMCAYFPFAPGRPKLVPIENLTYGDYYARWVFYPTRPMNVLLTRDMSKCIKPREVSDHGGEEGYGLLRDKAKDHPDE